MFHAFGDGLIVRFKDTQVRKKVSAWLTLANEKMQKGGCMIVCVPFDTFDLNEVIEQLHADLLQFEGDPVRIELLG